MFAVEQNATIATVSVLTSRLPKANVKIAYNTRIELRLASCFLPDEALCIDEVLNQKSYIYLHPIEQKRNVLPDA